MKKLSSRIYQHAFLNLQTAFNRFFKKISGHPKFKTKRSGDSFTVDNSAGKSVLNTGKKIKIPTLGTFRIYEPLLEKYITQTFTIYRRGEKWFVLFVVDAQKISARNYSKRPVIGIDVGVKTFATLSDGETYQLPPKILELKTKISKMQWRNRKKEIKSNNARKYYKKLAKLHNKSSNIRKDFLHKITSDIAQKYHTVKLEDLNISGLVQNHKFAGAIAIQGWGIFRILLAEKCDRVELVDRFFPSSKKCRICGSIHQNLTLQDRVFNCPICGHSEDRDLHAAQNLECCEKSVRLVRPEFTPTDKKMPTSLDEVGSKLFCVTGQ